MGWSCARACAWLACAAALAAAEEAPATAPRVLWAAPAAWSLEHTLLLNDVARREQDVGYKVRAELHAAPVWASDDARRCFLRFQLHSPRLHLKGKHRLADYIPYDSVWDAHSETTFYAYWNNGFIEEAYLDATEPPDILNFKKSLLSLFQIQSSDGEFNETDSSGTCVVLYETMSANVFRKIKRRCECDASPAVAEARRAARYELAAGGALAALHAEELLAAGHAQLGLKARVWLRLRPAPGAAAAPAPARAASLQAARDALPPALSAAALAPLAPCGADPLYDEEELELEAALEEGAEALRGAAAGLGGAVGEARAALRLLPALRAAPAARLRAALGARPAQLAGLARALGLAAARGAHAAAAGLLQLRARDPPAQLARAYLEAFALAPQPDEWAVREVLRVGAARSDELGAAALLAAAGAASHAADAPLGAAVRDALLDQLAKCRDEPCRAVRLQALGNLRRADTAEPLLQHALRPGAPRAALAALGALDALPPRALPPARLERLAALPLDARAPLEVRAAALDLLARRAAPLAAPVLLAQLDRALHARREHELRRVLGARRAQLAPRHAGLRALPSLPGWEARAPAGSSGVLARALGWAAGGWAARLDAHQALRAGVLRRAAVRLLAAGPAPGPANLSLPLLTVEVWTRGLHSLTGAGAGEGEAEAEGAAEEVSAGLALSVGGRRAADVPLFASQAELLALVWAGAGAAPTPVLRALLAPAPSGARLPLLGGAELHVRTDAALALALDASAQVSLWWRTARGALELRAGLLLRAALRVRTAWGAAGAAAELAAEPRLRLGADLDFSAAPALCVRARTESLLHTRNVTLRSTLGARRLRVRLSRETRTPAPGRTLALGADNDRACRTLRSADPDEL